MSKAGMHYTPPTVEELNDTIAKERKRANDQWAAACMEREIAEYWKKKAEGLLAALQAFVKAEDDWRKQKGGMPEGTFDDPLTEAYKQAVAAIRAATSHPAAEHNK